MHTKKVLAAFLAVVLVALSIPLMGGVAASEGEVYVSSMNFRSEDDFKEVFDIGNFYWDELYTDTYSSFAFGYAESTELRSYDTYVTYDAGITFTLMNDDLSDDDRWVSLVYENRSAYPEISYVVFSYDIQNECFRLTNDIHSTEDSAQLMEPVSYYINPYNGDDLLNMAIFVGEDCIRCYFNGDIIFTYADQDAGIGKYTGSPFIFRQNGNYVQIHNIDITSYGYLYPNDNNPYDTGDPYDTTFEDEPVYEGGPTVSLETYELTEDKWIVDLYVEDTYGTGISEYGFELYYNPEVISFADAESVADTIYRTFVKTDNTVVVISIADNIFPYEKTLLWRLEFDLIDVQDGSELGIIFNHENVSVTAQSGEELAGMTTFIGLSERLYEYGPTVSLETYDLDHAEGKWIVDLYVEDTYETGITDYGFELYYNPEMIFLFDAKSMTDTSYHDFSLNDSSVSVISGTDNIFPYEKTLLWRLEFIVNPDLVDSELSIFFNHENVGVIAQNGQRLEGITNFIGLSERLYEYGPTVSLETYDLDLTEGKWIVDLYVEDTYGTGITDYGFELYYNTNVIHLADAKPMTDTSFYDSHYDNLAGLDVSTDGIFPYEKMLLWRLEFIVNPDLDEMGLGLDVSFIRENAEVIAQNGQRLEGVSTYIDLSIPFENLYHNFTIENGILVSYNGPGGVVTVPDGVTGIGRAAFGAKEQIEEVIIPEGVTYIDSGAFHSCHNLTKVTLPESLTVILYDAFWYCTSLETIEIPDSVTTIEGSIFEGCNVTVYCYEDSAAHKHAVDNNIKFVLLKPESTPGDATGDNKVNLGDVSLILKHIAKWEVSPDLDAADVTGDGKVNLADVSLILKYIAKWDVVLK